MISDPPHRPVSALRQRMIEDMRVRGFTEKTRSDYVRNGALTRNSLTRFHETPPLLQGIRLLDSADRV